MFHQLVLHTSCTSILVKFTSWNSYDHYQQSSSPIFSFILSYAFLLNPPLHSSSPSCGLLYLLLQSLSSSPIPLFTFLLLCQSWLHTTFDYSLCGWPLIPNIHQSNLPSFILSSEPIVMLPCLSLTHFLTIPCRLGLKITSSNLREFLLPPPPSIPFFSPWAQYYNTSFKTQRIDRCHEWRTSDSCLKWYLRFDNSWALTQYCCNKWVFWIKCNPCASISQYKACLLKLDYHETFNLVINLTTIQIVPSITLSHRWEVHQLDINNTFLLEYPYEEVFISNYLASFVSLDPITFVVCANLFIAWRHTSSLVHWV